MRKAIIVDVDVKIAKRMLRVAGFEEVKNLSDEEIVRKAVDMCAEYGVRVLDVQDYYEDDGK